MLTSRSALQFSCGRLTQSPVLGALRSPAGTFSSISAMFNHACPIGIGDLQGLRSAPAGRELRVCIRSTLCSWIGRFRKMQYCAVAWVGKHMQFHS